MTDNKAVVEKFLLALGKGDVDSLKKILSEDVTAICTGTSGVSGTRDYTTLCATAGMLGAITKAGIDFRVISMTAEDDRVSSEVEGYSTLVNGQAYNNQYHFLFSIRNGLIYRIKEYIDTKLADETLLPLFQSLSKS